MEQSDAELSTNTVNLVVNDAIPNGERLRRHRISDDPPNCTTCGQIDDTLHRVKYCIGSSTIWPFLTQLLIQRLALKISDPSELLSGRLDIHGEAGLWLSSQLLPSVIMSTTIAPDSWKISNK
jgi:hypothetical protein